MADPAFAIGLGKRLWPDGTPGHEGAIYCDFATGRWWVYTAEKWREYHQMMVIGPWQRS